MRINDAGQVNFTARDKFEHSDWLVRGESLRCPSYADLPTIVENQNAQPLTFMDSRYVCSTGRKYYVWFIVMN